MIRLIIKQLRDACLRELEAAADDEEKIIQDHLEAAYQQGYDARVREEQLNAERQ